MKAWICAHPVLAYYLLTFSISWGGVLLVIGGPAGMVGLKAQDNPLFPIAVLAMVAGPSVSGLLLTAIVDGPAGLRAFRARLLGWRVPGHAYAVALLAAPILTIGVSGILSWLSPEFRPGIGIAGDQARLLMFALGVGLTAGLFEEIGWTGFAIPRLRLHHDVLTTGLIAGLLWSAWHILVVAWGIGDRAGTVPLAVFILVDGFGTLPAFRVLMVWLYDRTDSLLLAILMHMSLTACAIALTPQVTGLRLLIYGSTLAAALWIVIAVALHGRRGSS